MTKPPSGETRAAVFVRGSADRAVRPRLVNGVETGHGALWETRGPIRNGELDDILLKPIPWRSHRDARGRMVIAPDERASVPTGHRAAHLLDVAADHMRVRVGSLRTGDAVALVVEGFVPFRATVAWTTGDEAGLDFARPLHATMVHHLARLTPKAELRPVAAARRRGQCPRPLDEGDEGCGSGL